MAVEISDILRAHVPGIDDRRVLRLPNLLFGGLEIWAETRGPQHAAERAAQSQLE